MGGEQAEPLARRQEVRQPQLRPGLADPARQLSEGLTLLGGRRVARELRCVRAAETRQHRCAQVIEQVREDLTLAPLVRRQQAEDPSLVPARARAEHLGREPAPSVVEDREVLQGRPRCASQDLVRERERVAHAAARPPGQLARDAVLGLDALGREHLVEAPGDPLLAQGGELEHLTARQDGVEHAMRLGRREEELDVRRRLLERLQQRVERRLRQHVDLVHEVDLGARLHGRVRSLVTQRAHVLDAVVRGPVDLDQVRLGARVGRLTANAGVAGLGAGPLLAVQRLGEDACRGGLARAPRPGEEVGVTDPVSLEGALKGALDLLLPDDLGEGARAVLAGEDDVGHAPSLAVGWRRCPCRAAGCVADVGRPWNRGEWLEAPPER